MASALVDALPAGPVSDAELLQLFTQLVEDERAGSTKPDAANIPRPKVERFVANGRALFAAGAIRETTTVAARECGEVTATCAGSSKGSSYRLVLCHEGDEPSFSCTCPYFTDAQNGFCKHIVALVIWHCERLGEKERAERKSQAGVKDEDGWFSRPAPGRSNELAGKAKPGVGGGGAEDTDAGGGSRSGSGQQGKREQAEPGPAKADDEGGDASMDDIFDDWLGGATRKEIDRGREKEEQERERKEKDDRERRAAELIKESRKLRAESDSMDDLFDDWLGGGASGKENRTAGAAAATAAAATTTTTTTTTAATAATGASVSQKAAPKASAGEAIRGPRDRDRSGHPLQGDQRRHHEPQEGSSQAASVSASESPRRAKRASSPLLQKRAHPHPAAAAVDVDSWKGNLEERLTQSKRARKKAGGKVSFTAKFLKLGYKLKPKPQEGTGE